MEGEKNKFIDYYFKNYKKFLFIPVILLLTALISIFLHYQSTGDFIQRDITLKGGISLTILEESELDMQDLESSLGSVFSSYDVSVRSLKSTGSQIGFLIESDIPELDQDQLDSILSIVGDKAGKTIEEENYSFETMGSSLGRSFFNQTIRALIIAFLFMGIVVFLYFRTFVPSMAVIFSALSDIIVTVAIVNIIGIKFSTAGIAALLMLIGYSIDTDIMLTTRVLKRKEPTIAEAVKNAFGTGLTMTLTTIAAITVALIFTQSEVIKQIMTILLIGLVIDIINTWLQNSGLLLWYIERKNGRKNKEAVH
jgi:preprotein translocase subunit SecF